jgi:hypothetical protein
VVIRKGGPRHTGEERYEVELVFSEEDQEKVYRMTGDGKIVPDRVVLVWVRRVGQPWYRLSANAHGSRVEGYVKTSEACGPDVPRKSMEIYTRNLGNFKAALEYLPGLRLAIEKEEENLPE